MWLCRALGESWPELIDRLNTLDKLADWQRTEPALGRVQRLDDLIGVTAVGADPIASDAVLGALVRLAAIDGGNDIDATLVVLHLLRPGLTALRNRLLVVGVFDADALVVGQAMIQIRSFPWRRRTRAHAANVVRDTNKALVREFMPTWNGREVLVDPQRCEEVCGLTVDGMQAGDEVPEVELHRLLSWAERVGAVAPDDLDLLLEYTAHRGVAGAAHARVAAARGISIRSSKRHCAAALEALRAAVPGYLAA